MITLLLYLLRLLRFLFGGHRQLAPGEPRSPPATRRIQTNGASAQAAHDGPPLVGRARHSLGRLEAGSGHRVAQHRPAVAAASLPRALDGALWAASAGP